MSDYEDVANWRKTIEKYFEENQKIDDEFYERFFSKNAQLRFLINTKKDKLNPEETLLDAMIMNGLSGIDCRNLDFSRLSARNYTKIAFDSQTQFPEEVKQVFEHILERGKDFGFGLEKLLGEGKLSGEGINVAVIDQDFDESKIDKSDFNIVQHDSEVQEDCYHGITVVSLIASKSCGVAKGANIYFDQKTSAKHREEYEYYKSQQEQNKMSKEDFSKWREANSLEVLKSKLQKIIDHNATCEEKDKITVLSGSWRMEPTTEFEQCQQSLRAAGCELVCQNNFIENFVELVDDEVVLQFSEEEKSEFPEEARKKLDQLKADEKIKIPINRTYHQFGTNSEFKYQASFSNSWGIPQAAGLLALYKAKDKSLTFEEFCTICRETAKENGVINPVGIYESVMKRVEKTNSDNNGLKLEDKDEEGR